MTQKEFSSYFGIPLRTYQKWEYFDEGNKEGRKPPDYIKGMIVRILELEGKMKGSVHKDMSLEETSRLTNKISIKQLNNMNITSEAAVLNENLKDLANSSSTFSSALGLNKEAGRELEEYIGEAMGFPFLNLEKTLEFALSKVRALREEIEKSPDSPDVTLQKSLIDRIASAQWHFNRLTKELAREYLTTETVSTYDKLSPYMDVDSNMVLKELSDYEVIASETKEVLASKDLKGLYKCNADIMVVSTNITQYKYCI